VKISSIRWLINLMV